MATMAHSSGDSVGGAAGGAFVYAVDPASYNAVSGCFVYTDDAITDVADAVNGGIVADVVVGNAVCDVVCEAVLPKVYYMCGYCVKFFTCDGLYKHKKKYCNHNYVIRTKKSKFVYVHSVQSSKL